MATYTFDARITVEGNDVRTPYDAPRELQVMLNDYEDNNPDSADIIIQFN